MRDVPIGIILMISFRGRQISRLRLVAPPTCSPARTAGFDSCPRTWKYSPNDVTAKAQTAESRGRAKKERKPWEFCSEALGYQKL
ncbi:hypothetical protein K1719_022206 [Acacia pycnantha]|nr:hypothetical protein K1719_022206 [Acacia pycnantha]